MFHSLRSSVPTGRPHLRFIHAWPPGVTRTILWHSAQRYLPLQFGFLQGVIRRRQTVALCVAHKYSSRNFLALPHSTSLLRNTSTRQPNICAVFSFSASLDQPAPCFPAKCPLHSKPM